MALFNAGFPVSYQPMVYPSYNPQPYSTPVSGAQNGAQSNGIIWVQGEAGAKSYLVAPNNTVQLWDSENQTIYLKSADASGMPSIKILDYTIRETGQNGVLKPGTVSDKEIPDFATKTELEAVLGRIAAIQKQIDVLKGENEA